MNLLSIKKILLTFLILFTSCSNLRTRSDEILKLKNEGHYLIIGCSVYDLDGNIKRALPGQQCVFHEDGSFVSYSPNELSLKKYNSFLKQEWEIPMHVHHGISLTSTGDYLINSSSLKKTKEIGNLRNDLIMLISPDGKIKKKYDFNSFLKTYLEDKPDIIPYKKNWDKNLNFQCEYTHLAGSYELSAPIHIDKKTKIDAGNFIITLNTIGTGVHILQADMSKLLYYQRLPSWTIHDIQRFSETEVIFLENNQLRADKEKAKAFVTIYNLAEKRIVKRIDANLFAYFGGSVQIINKDLLLITDSNSSTGKMSDPKGNLTPEQIVSVHEKQHGGIIFYSLSRGIIHEIHMNHQIHNAKLGKLDNFLLNNKGL